MELKAYQHKVLKDLEKYLTLLQETKSTGEAFRQFWEGEIGPYNQLEGTGMEPYKKNIPRAVHLTVKVPTAGGKTFIAVNALKTIFNNSPSNKPKAVIWLVPWSNLLDQTVNNLRDPDHPYRQKLNALFNHRVEVYEKTELLQGAISPTTVNEQLTIIVMSFASLRARKKEDRKVYQENGQLASFAAQNQDTSHLLEDVDETALINIIRGLNPVLIVDESHNAESDLSIEMLNNLNPSFILDLTATPKQNSNIISMVPAIQLKKENMVKLPVIVYNHQDKTEVINSALHLQRKLELSAIAEEKRGGKYIRPIVLFQAQPKTKDDNTTFEKLKAQLLQLKIPEEQIKIKTANINELKGLDLMSRDCPVRYIITINALKEGWDCPFAYVLASLADKSSAVDVEQILGRVLRQPYVMKHATPLLNVSFVLTASTKFSETLNNIVAGLQASGFSDKDYRKKDAMPEESIETEKKKSLSGFLFPESEDQEAPEEDEFDESRISFDPDLKEEVPDSGTEIVRELEEMAEEQNKEMEASIEREGEQNQDDIFFQEMGDKVKSYALKEVFKEKALGIRLPQFFLKVKGNSLFGLEDEMVMLNSESLLKDFRLSNEDIKVNFEQTSSDLYKVDIDQDNEDRPTIIQIEDSAIREPIAEYILSRPKEKQIQDVTHQLIDKIGDMFPIPDQEIKKYVSRILDQMDSEQLREVLYKQYTYRDKIKRKIKQLANAYAEVKFYEQVTINKIFTEASWSFKKRIVPGSTGSPIGKSLYEVEGKMNLFEEKMIFSISSFPNVVFWHRNLERGKGFAINGFFSKHYPDFILLTEKGNVILLETKGNHLDGSDSAAKARLGNKWAELAGSNFHYFMVFDSNPIDGTYSADKAKELIKQL